jgi:hypothetical protein
MPRTPQLVTSRAANTAASGTVAGTTLKRVLRVTDFSVTLSREIIRDRSDNSQYETILDVVTMPYQWRLTSLGDWEGVEDWTRAELVGGLTMELYPCTGAAAGHTLLLEHCAVESVEVTASWGEPHTLSMTGIAIQCESTGGGAGTLGKRLEGTLVIQRDNTAANEQRKGDGSNHWTDAIYQA